MTKMASIAIGLVALVPIALLIGGASTRYSKSKLTNEAELWTALLPKPESRLHLPSVDSMGRSLDSIPMQVIFAPHCSACSANTFRITHAAKGSKGIVCFIYDRDAKDEIPEAMLRDPRFRFVFEANRKVIPTEFEPLLPMQVDVNESGFVVASRLIGRP